MENNNNYIHRGSLELTPLAADFCQTLLNHADLIQGSFTPALAQATCDHLALEMWLEPHVEMIF